MKRIIHSLTLGVFLAALAIPNTAPTVLAKPGKGKGMEISPLTVVDTVRPGGSTTHDIRLRNLTSVNVVAAPEVHDFTAGKDETGDPLIDTLDENDSTYSMRRWVDPIGDVHLKPGETKTVTVKVNVPADAEPGGHYGAVLFTLSAESSADSSAVALGASIGTLFLVRVTGTVTEKLTVKSFYSINDKGDRAWLLDGGPVRMITRLYNEGSVHERPEGNITVTDMFGRKVGTMIVNEKNGHVLPKSVRRFDNTLEKKNLFGLYTAKLNLVYADGQKLSAKMHFVVFPWQLILLIVLGILIALYLFRASLARYRESILRQARGRVRKQ